MTDFESDARERILNTPAVPGLHQYIPAEKMPAGLGLLYDSAHPFICTGCDKPKKFLFTLSDGEHLCPKCFFAQRQEEEIRRLQEA